MSVPEGVRMSSAVPGELLLLALGLVLLLFAKPLSAMAGARGGHQPKAERLYRVGFTVIGVVLMLASGLSLAARNGWLGM